METLTNVIRDIELLPLSPKAMEIGKRLLSQIDMQVVFWINCELENNIRSRHSRQKNQFWVTVKPQDDPDEFERLILAGLYGGIQERKRYLSVWMEEKYIQKLRASNPNLKNADHAEVYYDFLNFINSFVTSLDTEMFLKQYGITTSEYVRNKKFQDAHGKLEEYIQIKRKYPHFNWYRETEVWNLIEYGNFWRWGYSYQKQLKKLITKVNPHYLGIVERMAYKINDILARYNGENGEKLTAEMLQYIVKTFQLEHMVRFYRPMTKAGKFQFHDGKDAPIISFIPEDYPNQELLINWYNLSSEFIGTIREVYAYDMPDVGFNLVRSERCNEYSNADADNEYFISCTTEHILRVNECIESYDIYTSGYVELIGSLGEHEYRKRLFKFVVFFMTAHEYAHILNGDCNKSVVLKQDLEKEFRADKKAIQLVEEMIGFQYRLTPRPEDDMKMFQYYFEKAEFQKALQVIYMTPEARKQEMVEEVKQLFEKCRQDKAILKDAIAFVEDYRTKGE
jgi:hypothetical protein